MQLRKDKKPKPIEYDLDYPGSFMDKALFMKNLDKAHRSGKSPQVTISKAEYILVGNEKGTVRGKVSGGEILADGDVDAYLMDNYGDGSYVLDSMDKDFNSPGKYKTNIGDVKEKKEKKKSEDGDETKSSKKSTDAIVTALINQNTELTKAYMQFMAQNQQNTRSSSEDLEHIAKTIKELKSDDGEYRQMVNQLIGGLIQNAFSPGSSFEETLRAVQLLKEVSPEVKQEDTLTSVVNLLFQIFAARAGGGQPQFTPQQMQMLQQYIPGLAGQGQQPLPPGQTQAQPQTQAPLAGTQPQTQTTPQPQAQTPAQDISQSSNERHRMFYSIWIDPLRNAITSGQSDYDIAKWMVDMMEYSVDLMRLDPRNEPHPLVAAMVRYWDNPIELNKELYKFFDSIPELAGMKQRQDSIQANIVSVYTGSPDTEMTGQPEEPLTGAKEDDADNADLGGQQVGDADQQDGEAVSGEIAELEDDPSQLP